MRITVLGTGTMGAGMARSMLRAGHEVTVWNRSAQKAEPLADAGAVVADSARAAVAGADVVITMLFDADSVLAVASEIADAMAPTTVWVQASTIGLDGVRRAAAFAEEHGLHLIDAPVLGTKKPAEDGNLVVLASGDPGRRDAVQPVFDAIGGRTIWVSDDLGDASALKLAANAWITSITAAVAQSLALARGFGIDPQLFFDAIAGGPADSVYAQLKGAEMVSGEYRTAFALDGARKDIALIEGAAAAAGIDTRLLEALGGLYAGASAAGFGDYDMGAVFTAFAPGED